MVTPCTSLHKLNSKFEEYPKYIKQLSIVHMDDISLGIL
jgi:hypothetical protein